MLIKELINGIPITSAEFLLDPEINIPVRECSAAGHWDSVCLNHSGPCHYCHWSAIWAEYSPCKVQSAGLSFLVMWRHAFDKVSSRTSDTRFPAKVLRRRGSPLSHPRTMRLSVHMQVFSAGMCRILDMCFRRRATINALHSSNHGIAMRLSVLPLF